MREVRRAGALGHETGAQPTVGDLTGEPQHGRGQRRQIDRDLVLGARGQPHWHGVSAGPRNLELTAGVGDLVSVERPAHELDGFA